MNQRVMIKPGRGASPTAPKARADSLQIGGDHYKTVAVQPWTAMESWMTTEEFRGFLKGNAIKYLARERSKGGELDVRKAHHYLTKLLETFEGNGE